MDKEEVKQELIKRYKYLYSNSEFVLAPYMFEQTIEDLKKISKTYKGRLRKFYEEWKEPLIYLNNLDNNMLFMLESFLLSDDIMENTELYIIVEQLKNDKEYLEKVKNGLVLLARYNKNKIEVLKQKLDLWKLLVCVRGFITEQSGDLKNRHLKLEAMEEYFRIFRYSNDGKVWHSGYELLVQDMNNVSNYSHNALVSSKVHNPSRDKSDIGVLNNDFINILIGLRLSEKEKQEIYLEFHDELPCDLLINCNLEEVHLGDILDKRLIRPEVTKPCGCQFNVVEDEIFIDDNNAEYRYYQLCPKCSYIVNIPEEVLSVGVRKRIVERCSDDPNLFRKMFLYSELKKLDDIPTTHKKKMLVK